MKGEKMVDISKQINYERVKIVIGLSLSAFGRFIGLWTRNTIETFQSGLTQLDNINVGPDYPFWLPKSWEVLKVPDYLLQYLVLGGFITAVGLTLVASSLWKRIEMYSDSQQVRPVGEPTNG